MDPTAWWMTKYSELTEKIQERYCDVRIVYLKNHSIWNMLPNRFKKIAFAFGSRIFLPAKVYDIRLLAHEYDHISKQKCIGMFNFLMMYFSPQINAIQPITIGFLAAIMGVYPITILCWLASLIMLLPWPSAARVHVEKEAYLLDLAVEWWIAKEISDMTKKKVVDSLISPLYYKMLWSRKKAEKIVDEMIDQIINRPETLMDNVAFRDTYEILHDKTTV